MFKDKKKVNKYLQPVQDTIDLHGLTKKEAESSLLEFLSSARQKKFSKVRIITGKGLHSENGCGVLNRYIKNLLNNKNIKNSDAKLYDGGSGAIDVQL